jgi:hypothetical protein
VAVKTFYLTALNTGSPSFWGRIQDGGTAPAPTLMPSGWTVAKSSVAYWRARIVASATSTTSSATSFISASTGPTPGTGSTNTTASDSWATTTPLNGTFAAGNWQLNFGMRTAAATSQGRIFFKIWASANADGSSARQISSGATNCNTVAMTATNTTFNSDHPTYARPAVTLNNEYLFFQVEWNVTTAGSSNSATAQFYNSACWVITPDFAPVPQTASCTIGGAGFFQTPTNAPLVAGSAIGAFNKAQIYTEIPAPVGGIPAGSTIVVFYAHVHANAAAYTVVDGNNNFYQDPFVTTPSGTNNLRGGYTWCTNSKGVPFGNSIFVNYTTNPTAQAAIAFWFTGGTSTLSPLDPISELTPIATGASTTPSATSPPSRKSIALNFIGIAGPSTDAFTYDADWSAIQRFGSTGGTDVSVAGHYQIFDHSDSLACAPTMGVSRDWQMYNPIFVGRTASEITVNFSAKITRAGVGGVSVSAVVVRDAQTAQATVGGVGAIVADAIKPIPLAAATLGGVGGHANYIRNPRAEGAVPGTPGTAPTYWTGWGSDSGLTQTIVGTGVEDGIPYIDVRWVGTTTSTATVPRFFELTGTSGIPVGPGDVLMPSIYCRLVGGSMTNVYPNILYGLVYYRADGSLNGSSGAGFFFAPTNAPLITQRNTISVSPTLDVNTAYVSQQWRLNFLGVGVDVDLTLRIGAPQVEKGYGTTDPILPPIGSPGVTERAIQIRERVRAVAASAFAGLGGFDADAIVVQKPPETLTADIIINGVGAVPVDATAVSVTPPAVTTYFPIRGAIYPVLFTNDTALEFPVRGVFVTSTASAPPAGPQTYTASVRINGAGAVAVSAIRPGLSLTASTAIGGIGGRSNVIRNPRAEGAVPGTPGTYPTYWQGLASPDPVSGLNTTIVGTGYEDGIPYIDVRFFGTTGAVQPGHTDYILFEQNNWVTPVGETQPWTFSYYTRLIAAGDTSHVFGFNHGYRFLDQAGALIDQTNWTDFTPTTAPLRTQRYSVYETIWYEEARTIVPYWSLVFLGGSTGGSFAVDITLRIGGPQLEYANEDVASGLMLPPIGSPGISSRAIDIYEYIRAVAKSTIGGQGTVAVDAFVQTPAGVIQTASVSIAGQGGVQAFAATRQVAQATIGGVGNVAASASPLRPAAVTIAGVGAVAANALRSSTATVSIGGVGNVAASAISLRPVAITIAGGGMVTANAQRFSTATIAIAGVGLVAASAAPRRPVAVSIGGIGGRTNFVRNPRAEGAVPGTPGTPPTYWTEWYSPDLASGLTQTIVGTGYEDGIPYLDVRLFGTTTEYFCDYRFFETYGSTPYGWEQPWSSSFYARVVGGSTDNIQKLRLRWSMEALSGRSSDVAEPFDVTFPPPTSAPLIQQRYSYSDRSGQAPGLANAFIIPGWSLDFIDIDLPVDITLRIGGPQLEYGLPTTGLILPPIGAPAQITRAIEIYESLRAVAGTAINGLGNVAVDASVQTPIGVIQTASVSIAGQGGLQAFAGLRLAAQATIGGTGTISASANPLRPAAVTIAGLGAVSASALRSSYGTIAIGGVGSVAASAQRVVYAGSGIAGLGSVAVSVAARLPAAVTIAGLGNVSGSSEAPGIASAQIDGLGAVAVSAQRFVYAPVTIAGIGAISVDASRILYGTVAIAGAGAIGVASARHQTATTAVAGLGAVGVNALRSVEASTSIAGLGTVSASVTQVHTAKIGIAGLGSIRIELEGAAAYSRIDGRGTIAASAAQQMAAAATIGGIGSVAVDALRSVPAATSIAGLGAVSVLASRLQPATVAVAGVGSVSASASRVQYASVGIVGVGAVSAAAALQLPAKISIAGVGLVTVDAFVAGRQPASASMAGVGSVTFNTVQRQVAAVSIGGVGAVSGAVPGQANTAITIAGQGNVAVTATPAKSDSLAIAGTGSVSVRADVQHAGACAIAGNGNLDLTVRQLCAAVSAITGHGRVDIDAVGELHGGVTIGGLGLTRVEGSGALLGVAHLEGEGLVDIDVISHLFAETEIDGEGHLSASARLRQQRAAQARVLVMA